MKYGIIDSSGTMSSLVDRVEEAKINSIDGVDFVIVENPLTPIPPITTLNTCVAVQNYYISNELREQLNSQLKLVKDEPTKSTLYALFNGVCFSEWMEVSYSGRFMTKEVGPNVGFATGVGIRVRCEINQAIPQLKLIEEALKKMGYRGEVCLGLTGSFQISTIFFGHFWGHFGMYAEISKSTTQQLLDFLIEDAEVPKLYDSVCVSNLVSLTPFPAKCEKAQTLNAPKGAEKHLWRATFNGNSIALIAVHGLSIYEARRRIRTTLENMLKYDSAIQFRTDYGLDREFVLCSEEYDQFKEKTWTPSDRPTPSIPQA